MSHVLCFERNEQRTFGVNTCGCLEWRYYRTSFVFSAENVRSDYYKTYCIMKQNNLDFKLLNFQGKIQLVFTFRIRFHHIH